MIQPEAGSPLKYCLMLYGAPFIMTAFILVFAFADGTFQSKIPLTYKVSQAKTVEYREVLKTNRKILQDYQEFRVQLLNIGKFSKKSIKLHEFSKKNR